MFEKEAEKYIKVNNLEWELECHRTSPIGEVKQAFQKGAEFGYNKANEWHYVKDGDLPKDNRYILIVTRTDVYRGFYENNNWYGDEGGRLRCIAWKELPELPKEIKE